MKVIVSIEKLELKIAQAFDKSDEAGHEEESQYWSGKAYAYLDILYGYLGMTDQKKQWELQERIIKKYSKQSEEPKQ
jgi:hypothetical protein